MSAIRILVLWHQISWSLSCFHNWSIISSWSMNGSVLFHRYIDLLLAVCSPSEVLSCESSVASGPPPPPVCPRITGAGLSQRHSNLWRRSDWHLASSLSTAILKKRHPTSVWLQTFITVLKCSWCKPYFWFSCFEIFWFLIFIGHGLSLSGTLLECWYI